ncbi:MAG: TraR/DksA family transcriptional regulator [Nitrospira sp. NTP1]|nr:TraR/DksA family transcriptional regulator [Nitrospira sp. NTP1]
MGVTHAVRSRSRHQAFRSIRRQLLQDQRNLLRQAASWGPPATESELPADVLDIATCDRDLALDDLMRQRAFARLQQVNRALSRIDQASYGMCHLCRADIPLPRLRAQPDATLCVDCKSECEHRALLRTGT